MTRQERIQARAVLANYYASSVSGSVLSTPPVVVEVPTPLPPHRTPPADAETRTALIGEAAALREEIDAAYWRFTRQARALPPSMQCPQAYARLAAIKLLLGWT